MHTGAREVADGGPGGSGGGRGGRGARPDPAPARDPAQLPGHRPRPLPARARSAPSCASTSSPATTRSGRSAATSAAGCTRRPSWRTTTSASAPTTTSSTPPGYLIVKHRTFGRAVPPSRPTRRPGGVAAVRQGARRRPRAGARAFRPDSVVNISGMSFGSLSGNAVEALNRGAALAGCLQNTGEGGISPLPPPRRRAGLPDRHRLLRLPRRAGPLRPGAAQGRGRRRARCGRSRSSSARARSRGSAGCCPAAKVSAGDRRDPRDARWRRTASARRGTPSSPTPTRCSTGSRCWPPRPGCRSGSSRPSATWRSGTSSAG